MVFFESLVKNVKLSKRDTFVSDSFQVQLKDLSKKELKKLGIDAGVKITATKNKAFSYYKVGEGYVITKINGNKVYNASEAVKILDKYTGNNRLFLEVISPEGDIERYRF